MRTDDRTHWSHVTDKRLSPPPAAAAAAAGVCGEEESTSADRNG